MSPRRFRAAAALVLLLAAGCGGSGEPLLLAHFAFDDDTGLLETGDHAYIDDTRSVDGGGSLHLFNPEFNLLVNVQEFDTPEITGDTVVVDARMMSEMLGGDTSLDLWVFTEDASPRSIRRLCENIGRTKDWQAVEVRFPLLPDEKPVSLRIAVHLEGRGHLWIDDLQVRAMSAGDGTGRE
jgi:hypothetical protein